MQEEEQETTNANGNETITPEVEIETPEIDTEDKDTEAPKEPQSKKRRKRRKKATKGKIKYKGKNINTNGDEFDQFQKEWKDRLDGDTKDQFDKDNIEDEKEEEDIEDEERENIHDPKEERKRKAKELTPESLVAFCNILMPLLAVIALRIISLNKKRRPPNYFRYDEFETELLTQLADGAAEELEGKANKTVLFVIALGALSAVQVLDAYDNTPNVEKNEQPPEVTVNAEPIPQPQ